MAGGVKQGNPQPTVSAAPFQGGEAGGKRSRRPVCDKDCFHCPFDDCINDEMDSQDYAEAADRDRKLNCTEKGKQSVEAQRKYYRKNREKILAYQRAYYAKHREECAAYRKAYYEENREKLIAQAIARREIRRSQGSNKDNEWQKRTRERNRERLKDTQKRIREVRKELGLTQTAAGKIVGVSKRVICYWENGYYPCNVDKVVRMLKGEKDEA